MLLWTFLLDTFVHCNYEMLKVLHLSHEDFKINLKGVKICEWKKVD